MIGKHCGKPLIVTPKSTNYVPSDLEVGPKGDTYQTFRDVHPDRAVVFSRTCQVCGRVFTQRKRQPTKKPRSSARAKP